VTELREETGVVTDPADLIGFGTLSEAELHTVHYPGGDVSHNFAMLFLSRRWTGDPRPDGVETTAMLWAHPDSPPTPLDPPAFHALALFRTYLGSGEFQVS
jgi:hypothetical protein